ncbi:MAG: S-methyl-5-thioribose-1-phosphate isomerase [Cyanobacteria bacterium P01_H01_bin.74]
MAIYSASTDVKENLLPPGADRFNLYGSKVLSMVLNDHGLALLDQTLLTQEKKYCVIQTAETMANAIETMVVRGAPAIGLAAAYGVVLSCRQVLKKVTSGALNISAGLQTIDEAITRLSKTRPTAVNLFWALDQMKFCCQQFCTANQTTLQNNDNPLTFFEGLLTALTDCAISLHQADIDACYAIGQQGLACISKPGMSILTHCNAGALATGGYGTALGVIRAVVAQDQSVSVYAGETRPRLQGARLTTWELLEDGIDVTLITDGMSGSLMAAGKIDMVVVGADRIAKNGDVANKIGTYNLAVLAKMHHIPFYVAAPQSTFDPDILSGREIPIEHRGPNEITKIGHDFICHKQTKLYNPGFDITPSKLISGIITEKKILTISACGELK